MQDLGYDSVSVNGPQLQMGIFRIFFTGRTPKYGQKQFAIRFWRDDLYASNFKRTYALKRKSLFMVCKRALEN